MSRLGKLVMNNWSLKLLALVLAVLSFYAIRSTTSFIIPHDIVLEVIVDEEGITVLEQPETVRVTFRGSLDDLGRLDPSRIRAVVHPEATNPTGTEVISISSGNIEGARGVIVKKIEPKEVALLFDREIVRKFKVARPKTSGTPLRGRVELDYEPKDVMVRGSERRLATVEKLALETQPVLVDGRVESFVSRARVLPPSPTGLWRIVPPEVTVRVSIVTETVSRQWTNVAVRAVMEHQRSVQVAMEPEMVDVSLTGRAEAVNAISGSTLKLFVDCVGLEAPGTYELPVTVHLPGGGDLTPSVSPEVVKVIMKRDKEL